MDQCTDVGLIVAPLFIPFFILLILLPVIDLTLLVKRYAPQRHRQKVKWGVPTILLGIPVIFFSIYAIVTYRRDHYSANRAVTAVLNCQASSLGGTPSNDYLFLKKAPYSSITVSGGIDGAAQIEAAVEKSLTHCQYQLSDFQLSD